MKPSKILATFPGGAGVTTSAEDQQSGLGLPERLSPGNLESVFATLKAAVPALVGRDLAEQRTERLVIQGIYRVVEAVKLHAPDNAWGRESPYDKELERIINDRQEAAGGKTKARVQKNSPLETRIARCIFPDRRRAHIASKVIRAAMAAGKGPDELLAFIEENHGTEGIRRNTGGTSADEALRLMWTTPPLATVSLPRELVGEQGDLPKQMLFTVRRTGEVDIRWIGDNAATARSGLAAFAKARSVVSHDTRAS